MQPFDADRAPPSRRARCRQRAGHSPARWRCSAPMQPSTWNQRLLLPPLASERLQIVDGAGVDGAGRSDHAGGRESRRADPRAIAVRRAAGRSAARHRSAMRRSARLPQAERLHRLAVAGVKPDPSRRSAAALLDARRRRARARRCRPGVAGATVRPMMLAIEPPLTSVPLAEAGKPIISLHQSTTCWSMQAAAWLPPPRFEPWIAARKSPSAPVNCSTPCTRTRSADGCCPSG